MGGSICSERGIMKAGGSHSVGLKLFRVGLLVEFQSGTEGTDTSSWEAKEGPSPASCQGSAEDA